MGTQRATLSLRDQISIVQAKTGAGTSPSLQRPRGIEEVPIPEWGRDKLSSTLKVLLVGLIIKST